MKMPINDSNSTDEFDNTIVRVHGATDNTGIGNVGDRLKVTSNFIAPGGFTTFKSNTEITLASNTVWTNLHTVNGSGNFIGATFVVDNTEVECQIVIDGNIVFDFTGNFLKEVVNTDAGFKASGIFECSNDGKRLYMTPQSAFGFESSIVFHARLQGKKVKFQLYTYSVD